MKITKYVLLLSLLALTPMAHSMQDEQSDGIKTVSISAQGADVRTVLGDLFTQADKSYVIAPNIHFQLHLALKDMEFEEALNIVCKTASLKYELQNGIYYISKQTQESKPQPS